MGAAVTGDRIFLPALREVERELRVPLRHRVRILRELEYDLEEMHADFVAHGLSPEEARTRVVEALVPGRASLDALGRLHTPLYRRATRHLAEDRLRALERWTLAAAALGVLLGEALLLSRVDLLRDPSPFLWPVLALGALLFADVTAVAFTLWVKGEHREPGPGLRSILVLSAATLGTGMVGAMADFYRLSSTLSRMPDSATHMVSAWLVRDAALLSLAILVALTGALAWFVLTQWLAAVSGAHREILGLDRRGSLVTRRS